MQKLLNLQELGTRLHTVDTMIMQLVMRRMDLAEQVGNYKRHTGDPIFRSEVEDRRIDTMRKWAETHGVNPHFAETIEYLLINESCKLQMIKLQKSLQEPFDQDYPKNEDEWYEQLKRNLLVLDERWCKSYDASYENGYFATRAHVEYESDQIVGEIEKLTDRSLMLDLGCATGRTSFKFASQFDKVIGFDLSQHMQSKANEQAEHLGLSEKVHFESADLEVGIPVLDESASFVVMNLGTASDVRSIRHVIAEVLRVLKTSGRFFFSFYNRDALMYRWEILPWSAGLAASVNIHKDSLDVHSFDEEGVEQSISVFAKAYTVSEIRSLFSEFFVEISMATYPTISSILPNELFSGQEVVQNLVIDIDRKLADSDTGAYIIVTGEKI